MCRKRIRVGKGRGFSFYFKLVGKKGRGSEPVVPVLGADGVRCATNCREEMEIYSGVSAQIFSCTIGRMDAGKRSGLVDGWFGGIWKG